LSLEGKQIDRYAIMRLLGSGGMGDVYLAEDPRIGQQVAIKVIRTELSPYPDEQAVHNAARLFQREAKAIVKLDHPHILPLYDYGEEHIGNAPVIYLVMPYRPEGSLTDWLRHGNSKDLLSPQDIAQLVSQAADALQHAHEHQVIHQDVKPSNFLVRSRQDAPAHPDLLLSDFGIARLTTATSSVSQSIRGTPAYMAPEQWEGEPVPATDQYALAVMTYELLTGKLPFQGGPGKMMYHHINTPPPPPSSLNPQLSSDKDTVLMHALAKQPERRFTSIAAFANAFQHAVQSAQSIPMARPITKLEEVEKTIFPIDTGAPTRTNSGTPLIGSDTETFVKPINTPAMVTSSGPLSRIERATIPAETKVGFPILVKMVTPTPHRDRRRPLVLVALILLVLALVGGMAYALPSISTPVIASSSTVMITPARQDLKNIYTILSVTNTPDISRKQITARLVSSITPSQIQTVNASGKVNTPAIYARGILGYYNFTSSPVTLNAGMIVPNKEPPPIHMMFDATITIPAAPTGQRYGYTTGPAHVVEVGVIGNLPST
jgi:serine/threonine protein kinase